MKSEVRMYKKNDKEFQELKKEVHRLKKVKYFKRYIFNINFLVLI